MMRCDPTWPLSKRLQHYSRPHPSGCRLWTAAKTSNGYGQMHWKGRLERAHRLAWVAAHGPIPPGRKVCHRCDVKLCIEEDHLFLGTQRDNMRDKMRKGRHVQVNGEHHGRSKLTLAKMAAIRRDRRSAEVVAEAHDVLLAHVLGVRSRVKNAGKIGKRKQVVDLKRGNSEVDSLGKGEAAGSIPAGSTSFANEINGPPVDRFCDGSVNLTESDPN